MPKTLPLLVFSDLDGTLLDHQDYSWAQARPGLKQLCDMGAGLVLASSKTAAEIDGLRRDMGFPQMPAIVENGAGILWGNAPAETIADEYTRLRSILTTLPPGFRGFGDMSVDEISKRTGLTPNAALLAKRRQFSEPGLWTGPPEQLDTFLRTAEQHGLQARQGGRFLSLSFGKTKADAMAEVIRTLKPRKTIALGDAPNDLEMILAADQGVIIANPHGAPIPTLDTNDERRILRTKLAGPEGWSDAILTLTAAH